MVSLKLMEVKLEMSQGSTSKGLLAICLSNVFGDVQNWSSGVSLRLRLRQIDRRSVPLRSMSVQVYLLSWLCSTIICSPGNH